MENQQKPKSIEGIFPNDLENSEVQNDLDEIKELGKQIDRNDLIEQSNKYKYSFRNVQQQDLSVTVFLMAKLWKMKLINNQAIY